MGCGKREEPLKTIGKCTLLFALVLNLVFGICPNATSQDQAKQLGMMKDLLNATFSTSTLEHERDQRVRQTQLVTKDEFETQAMFERRKQDAQRKVDAIRAEYDRRIADLRTAFDRRKEEIRRELQNLLASSAMPVGSEFSLGQYDADKEQFPVILTLTRERYQMRVPLAAARDFKNASASIKARGTRYLKEDGNYEYLNWSIADPTRNSAYAFGSQRGASAASTPVPQGVPPKLTATVTFTEPSGNNRLDAEESGELTVSVTNSGKGTAFGVEVSVNSQVPKGVRIPGGMYIGEIPPGQSRQASVAVAATSDVSDSTVICELLFKETYGFQPVGKRVSFETRRLLTPRLIVADFGIDDQSKNGRIEPGEITQITMRIQNTGPGVAHGVKASALLGSDVFLTAGSTSFFDLGDLAVGAYKDVGFSIYTNNNATAVPVFVTVTEFYGKYGITRHQIPLEFNKPVARMEDMVILGKEERSTEPGIAGGLSVDVDTGIPKGLTTNAAAVGVIFGVEQYRHVPSVTYAKRDAAIFKEYAVRTLGIADDPGRFISNPTMR
jgi:hypothetical protein